MNLGGIGESAEITRLFSKSAKFCRNSIWARGQAGRMDETLSSGQTASVEQVNFAKDTGDGRTNRLARAASAYLRSAIHQPVDWMEWGEAAFDRADRAPPSARTH